MKNTTLFIAFLFLSFFSFSQGPLTGQLVINKGEITANWNERLVFDFVVKNAGTKPISILQVIGSCECQASDPKNIQTIAAGKTGTIKVFVDIKKAQLGNQVSNGVINYDRSVIVVTNGKKEKYQLYTRATIKIKN